MLFSSWGGLSREVRDVAALISWVCRASHPVETVGQSLPTVTIHRGAWAYCSQGLFDNCVWEATEPVSVEGLRYARRPTEREAEQQASAGTA